MKGQRLPVAFSLLRFSTPEQRKGDSLRRQVEDAQQWCQRHGAHLDTTLWAYDPACSGFTGEHRSNPDRHALAAFLKMIELRRVPEGSYLLIENLDRLTREDLRPALRLWMDILDAGVDIVQINPERIFRHEKSDLFDMMLALMELSRGHGESFMKSDRVGKKWAAKKELARAGQPQPPRRKDGRVTRSLTDCLPAWIEDRGGELAIIPERGAALRRIYHLSAAGYGQPSIVKRFTAEGVPAFGRSGVWTRSYVAKLLRDRRVLGEFQPRSKKGKVRQLDGRPILDYFPAAITPDEFDAARAGNAQRLRRRGRTGRLVNVFAGLLRNARDGKAYHAVPGHGTGPRLVNASGIDARSRQWSFPLDVFEQAVLGLLRELDPAALLDPAGEPDETTALETALEGAAAQKGQLEADLDRHGPSESVLRALRRAEVREAEVVEQLAAARQRAATPLRAGWGECKTLLGALADAPDPHDARLRLRGLLRRLIDSVWLLVVPCPASGRALRPAARARGTAARGRERLCVVQIWFASRHEAGGKEGGPRRCRTYVIRYTPGRANVHWRQEGRWEVHSGSGAIHGGPCDLRCRRDARRVEAMLLESPA